MTHPYFENRTAILATKHLKEQVIAPIFERELGVTVVVPQDFDTDQFGTFTRDRPRPGSQRDAARLKAKMALELTGATLAIASEGTFAPHPSFPMLPANRELVLLLDLTHNLEIVGEEVSLETNYRHQTVSNLDDAFKFAQQVGFPSHGLVVMSNSAAPSADITKGITNPQQLQDAVARALARSPNGTIHLETDMRALYNPTRMAVIAAATHKLVQAIRLECPTCGTPGFTLLERHPGLPCGWCGLPSDLARVAIYQCPKCQFTQTVPFPDGINVADPAQCSHCNP